MKRHGEHCGDDLDACKGSEEIKSEWTIGIFFFSVILKNSTAIAIRRTARRRSIAILEELNILNESQ